MSRPSEDELIARFFAPLATLPGADGLRDDVALLEPPPGHAFVVTVDALVEGVHFLPDDPPSTIAGKALRVNLSDLAAKGAAPYGFMLSLALPRGWTAAWIEDFAKGLAADAASYGIALVGGDTVATPGPLSISITAFGTVPAGRIPRRGGARRGDVVVVSGTIGDGALGLAAALGREEAAALSAEDREALIGRYRLPEPRVAVAPLVLASASASMDVSDGLAGDIAKLCRASGVTATIDLDRVPLSPAARRAIAASAGAFDVAMTGGDDYEILATLAPDAADRFVEEAGKLGVPVSAIGTIEAGQGTPTFLRNKRAYRFAQPSFSHF